MVSQRKSNMLASMEAHPGEIIIERKINQSMEPDENGVIDRSIDYLLVCAEEAGR